MARRKPVQRNGMFVPVLFAERIQLGNSERAPEHLDAGHQVPQRCDRSQCLRPTLHAQDPAADLQRGLLSSRLIEQACETTSCLLT